MWRSVQVSAGVLFLAVSGAPLAAKVLPPGQTTCPSGETAVGGLGIVDLGCGESPCHPKMAGGGLDPRFLAEPEVQGIEKDRPADGALFRGDVLIAVQGLPLTTAEGGRRFASLPPDQAVTLKVRRDGVVRDVQLVTDLECWSLPKPPAPPRAPAAPAGPAGPANGKIAQGAAGKPAAPQAPTRPQPPSPPSPPDMAPLARLGFSFQCGNCGYRPSASGFRAWVFVDVPVVGQVEAGGPAAAAGLQPGDRLIQIDGVALTSPEGGRRFTEIKPAAAVQWTVERAGKQRTLRMVPEAKAAGSATTAGELPQRLRYTGTLGKAQIEVRGVPVNVSEDAASGELLIRSHDLLVRVTIPRS